MLPKNANGVPLTNLWRWKILQLKLECISYPAGLEHNRCVRRQPASTLPSCYDVATARGRHCRRMLLRNLTCPYSCPHHSLIVCCERASSTSAVGLRLFEADARKVPAYGSVGSSLNDQTSPIHGQSLIIVEGLDRTKLCALYPYADRER